MNLHDLIVEHWCDDPGDTATALLKLPEVRRNWKTLFFALLRDECRRQARHVARTIEQSSTGTTHDPDPIDGTSRLRLLDTTFYNGTSYVPWGTATVADHEGRIAHMLAFRAGVDRDIDLHRKAIADIHAADVTCLADLGDWPVAA